MLDRARATSLALVGATAAVGLGIVALALNQGWPLLKDNAIPAAPKQGLGSASVVSRPPGAAPARTGAARRRGGGQVGGRFGAPTRSPATAETPSGGEEAAALVVSQEAPARSPGGAHPKAPPTQGKAPEAKSQPAPSPTGGSPGSAPPSSPPAGAPTSPPEAAPPAPTQPEAVISEAPPEESSVPPWSNGKGHAYGRSEEAHGNGSGEGEH